MKEQLAHQRHAPAPGSQQQQQTCGENPQLPIRFNPPRLSWQEAARTQAYDFMEEDDPDPPRPPTSAIRYTRDYGPSSGGQATRTAIPQQPAGRRTQAQATQVSQQQPRLTSQRPQHATGQQPPGKLRPRIRPWGMTQWMLYLVVVVVLLVVLILPAVTAGATVTLVPASTTLSTALTITATTQGAPDPSRQEVEARLLSVSGPPRTQTVQTTGTGHAPARAAQGLLTLYNAAPYQQTVPPGTVLVGADGVEIVTEAPAVIPAGNPPIEGEITVLAHAVDTGPQGNIAPLDLNGLCCLAGVSVKNTTVFREGQDAYDYPAVSQHDIEQVVEPLLAPLTQATQASLQAQVRPNEHLLGFVQCQPTISPDHPAGSRHSGYQLCTGRAGAGDDHPGTQSRHETRNTPPAGKWRGHLGLPVQPG